MINDLNIVGGTVVSSNGLKKATISIKDGKISYISESKKIVPAKKVLEVTNCIIMPGMIDSHVHVRAPSFSHREDFQTGTRAAAAGGVTTIVEMPVSNPPTSNVKTLKNRIKNASENAYVDFGFWAGIGTDNVDEADKLAECGIVGFKTFLMPPPESREDEFQGLCTDDEKSLKNVLAAVVKTGLLLAIHAEDNSVISKQMELIKSQGQNDLHGFSSSRPPISEILAISSVIRIQMHHNANILICHVSTPLSIEVIHEAKAMGLNMYAETCPQYILLSEEKISKFGPFARVKPPIRKEKLRKELWTQFKNGLIDILSSDHAPYLEYEKNKGKDDIWMAPDGIPGLELSLPLLLNKVTDGEITYQDIVKMFSEHPAKLLGFYPKKGTLEIGSDADIVIVRPNMHSKVLLNNLFTKARNSVKVYEEFPLTHSIEYTISRGEIVFNKGKIVGNVGHGNFISPIM
ncbi:MAG: allantoinase [Thermoanaerobacteraceae bacterium]|nr:allantoinase [Thermoanaerobacteraceae bacterium]